MRVISELPTKQRMNADGDPIFVHLLASLDGLWCGGRSGLDVLLHGVPTHPPDVDLHEGEYGLHHT